ncbi:MAG: SlyX [Pseudomonadota bacterium]|jgi:SlyX protein
MMEERLIEIEMKLVTQEKLIEELSGVIFEQQKQIDLLEKLMQDQLRARSIEIGPHNVKPPHY